MGGIFTAERKSSRVRRKFPDSDCLFSWSERSRAAIISNYGFGKIISK